MAVARVHPHLYTLRLLPGEGRAGGEGAGESGGLGLQLQPTGVDNQCELQASSLTEWVAQLIKSLRDLYFSRNFREG